MTESARRALREMLQAIAAVTDGPAQIKARAAAILFFMDTPNFRVV